MIATSTKKMSIIVLLLPIIVSLPCSGFQFDKFLDNGGEKYFDERTKRYFDGFTSHRDVVSYFDQCPLFQGRMQRLCDNKAVSCSGRCGSTDILTFVMTYTPCACDQMCMVYGDCCLDFATRCPTQMQQYRHDFHSLFQGIELVQRDEFVAISGCPQLSPGQQMETAENGSAPLPFQPPEEDELLPWIQTVLQPLVTSKQNGLTFINISVYNKCNRLKFDSGDFDTTNVDERNYTSDALLWEKHVIGQNFVYYERNNVLMQKLFRKKDSITDSPPPGHYKRVIKPNLAIRCAYPLDSSLCYASEHIQVREMESVCSSNSIERRNQFSRDLNVTESYNETSETVCFGDFYTDIHWQKKNGLVSLSFMFSMGIQEETLQISLDDSTNKWGTIHCNSEFETCKLLMNCPRGYLPNEFTCLRPSGIVVDTIAGSIGGNNHIGTSAADDQIQEVLEFIRRPLTSMELNNPVQNMTKIMKDIIMIRLMLTFKRYDMTLDELETHFVKQISDYLEYRMKNFVHEVTLCFILSEEFDFTTMDAFNSTINNLHLNCWRYLANNNFKSQQFFSQSLNMLQKNTSIQPSKSGAVSSDVPLSLFCRSCMFLFCLFLF